MTSFFMREIKTWVAVVATLAGLIVLPGFGSRRTSTGTDANVEQTIAHHIAVLRSGTAQQKAASAYWLGQQHSSAADAVSLLAELLADKTEIDASRYRQAARDSKPTLGEEAAAALVQIGRSSIPPLIRILKTSPSPEARKNAAWALGALHESSAGEGPPSALYQRVTSPRA
jgi:HEAT repeat protein